MRSKSRDARGWCKLQAPGPQGGDAVNAGREGTVLGLGHCTPSCPLLGVPDLRCDFPQLPGDSWAQVKTKCALCCIAWQNAYWGTCVGGLEVQADHQAPENSKDLESEALSLSPGSPVSLCTLRLIA